jgi:hypothetical protein
MKIELNQSINGAYWDVFTDGRYVGKYVPKDWQLIETDKICLEFNVSGRLYLDVPRDTKSMKTLKELVMDSNKNE